MEFFKNIGDWWRGLGGGTRTLVVGGVLATALAIGLFVYLSPGEATTPVGPDMPAEEVKAVRDKLTASGIPNTLDRRGVNVLVPEARLAEAKVTLAAEGLPSRTGRGLESFEESSFGATPFQNSVNYQRALQNELTRAISQIESVAGARVLIARPDPTPFVRDQRPTTASVVLRLKPNAGFGKAAAASVVSLVAHAVDGLRAENVTVIDSTGRMLSDPYAANRDDLISGDMVDFRKALELHLAKKAQDTLTPALGAGRVVVTVNADLNYQKVKERLKRYTPEEKVVIAERLTTSKGTTTTARGAAGVTSNAARPGGGAGGSSGNTQEETTSTDYAFGELVREMDDRAGGILRLTVAAVVDLSPQPGADGAAGTEPVARPEDVQKLIETAVGFKTGRDEIKLANMKLTGPPVPEIKEIDEEGQRLARLQTYVSLARTLCIAFAAVVGFAIVPLALLRTRRRPVKPPEPAAPPPPTPEQLAAAARDRRRQQLEKLAELTRTNPDTVSDVFNILVSK